MTTISNCKVEVHPGPSDAQVDVVQGLQEVIMKQLELLTLAHKNLTPSNAPITGIAVSGQSSGTNVHGCAIEGARTAIELGNPF